MPYRVLILKIHKMVGDKNGKNQIKKKNRSLQKFVEFA